MSSRPLWQKAASFAAQSHRHQLRRDRETPYFAHPARVALTLAVVFDCRDETILAASLLHDVIEDCAVDYDDLHQRFGPEVADIVASLSKDTRVVEPERERAYDAQLAGAPWQARLIKLADVYDNLCSAVGPDVTRRQLERARRGLELAGDEPRLAGACAIVGELIEEVTKKLEGAVESGSG